MKIFIFQQFNGFNYAEWDGNPEMFELDPDKLGLPKFSAYIRGVLDSPDIRAVSEVESLKVLQDLGKGHLKVACSLGEMEE